MKATGIVRRIDDLGRVVIPKEIRRTMRIREGDPLEVFVEDGNVIYRKYSPLGNLSEFAGQYADSLRRVSGHPVIVCDRDHVIASAGIPRREMVEKRVSPELDDMMQQRKTFSDGKICPVDGVDRCAICGTFIAAEGEVCGAILFLSENENAVVGEAERKLLATAASFLGRQMED